MYVEPEPVEDERDGESHLGDAGEQDLSSSLGQLNGHWLILPSSPNLYDISSGSIHIVNSFGR